MEVQDPRFRIRAPLRCDGIGRLDCAEDASSGARLAVRWLPLEANGAAAITACERLPDHPTLPRIRHTGRVGEAAFVAMDFPDGKLLSAMLDEDLDVEKLMAAAAHIADALATIHAQGVFHGEMSSDSILLVPPRQAILWDMPLVVANRLTDRRGEERLMHQLVRTAPYLAPERARGGAASAESDVYALGAIICLALGSPRPVSSTTLGTVHQIATALWAPEIPQGFPDALRVMLKMMTSPEPSARPTAREVAEVFGRPPEVMQTVPEMPAVLLPEIIPPAPTPVMASADEPIPEPGPTAPAVVAPELPIISEKELSELEQVPRSKTAFAAGGAMILFICVALFTFFSSRTGVADENDLPPADGFVTQTAVAPAPPPMPVEAAPIVAPPVPAPVVIAPMALDDADLLAPMPQVKRAHVPPPARRADVARRAPKPLPAPVARTAEPAPTPAPAEELKRPEF